MKDDLLSLRTRIPKRTSAVALDNVVKMLTSGEALNDAQRGRIMATHVLLVEETQLLRAALASVNVGVERIVTQLGSGARKRTQNPHTPPPGKKRRL